MPFLRAALFLLALLGTTPAFAASADKWAVLSARSGRNSELAELVQTKLAAARFPLVERNALGQVTDEQALSNLSDSSSISRRVQLGRTLTADYLLILRPTDRTSPNEVSLIIADTRLGARLVVERLNLSDLPMASDRAVRAAQQCRQRYAAGIRRIVAAPLFLNDSLGHEHDILQSRFASLLESSLLSRPGVAVLETQEARAIADEIALGAQTAEPVVPLFLEPKFRVEQNGEVRLTIASTAAQGRKSTLTRSFRSIDEASKWISLQAVNELLPNGAAPVMTLDERFDALVGRADETSQMGFWIDAARLRMAALMLKPREIAQRKLANAEAAKAKDDVRVNNSANFRTMAEAQLIAWENAEYAIRTGAVDLREAMDLLGHVFNTARARYSFSLADREELERVRRNLVESVLPLARQLPNGAVRERETAKTAMLLWNSRFHEYVFMPFVPLYLTKTELQWRYKVLTAAPEDAKVDYRRWYSDEPAIRDYNPFRDRLEPGRPDAASQQDLNDFIERLCTARGVKPVERPKFSTSAPSRMDWRNPGALVEQLRPCNVRTTNGTLLDYASYLARGKYIGPFRQFQPGLDVARGYHCIYLMRTPDLIEEIPVRGASVGEIETDGTYIWVYRSNIEPIAILNSAGKTIAEIGKTEGLPPSRNLMALLSIGTGKLLIGGAIDESHRGWLALAELDPATGKPTVRIVHEAKRSPLANEAPEHVSADPTSSFCPAWLFQVPDPDGQLKVLIGRQCSNTVMSSRQSERMETHPLLLNLSTGQGTELPHAFGYPTGNFNRPIQSGEWLFAPTNHFMTAIRMRDLLNPAAAPLRIPAQNPPESRKGIKLEVFQYGREFQRSFLAPDGYLYSALEPQRIDTKSLVLQHLEHTGPHYTAGLAFSSFFGLYRFDKQGIYSLTINDAELPPAKSAPAPELAQRLSQPLP